MEIMQYRYNALREIMAGYEKTSQSLVGYKGDELINAHYGDDVGIYYFIPKIAVTFDLSLDRSIDFFYISILLFSLVLSIIGFYKVLKSPLGLIAVLIGLPAISFISYKTGDVYIVQMAVTISIFPLFLYLLNKNRINIPFVIFLLFSGICIGIGHYIRTNSGTPVLIFMIISMLGCLNYNLKKRIALVLVLIVGILLPVLFFNSKLSERDDYLAKHTGMCDQSPRQHIFWHSAYIGLGFLNNDFGLKYKDEVAAEKAYSLAPNAKYLSKEYEDALRGEVIRFVKEHPFFTAATIAGKAGIIAMFLVVFANFGLLASFIYPKPRHIELAFWSALGFSSLYGIIAIPIHNYLLGFIALAFVYGVISIDYAMESRNKGLLTAVKAANNKLQEK